MANRNKELIKKYPFLKIKRNTNYDTWSDCWLDELEPGWRIAFGEDLCKDLYSAIKEENCKDTFQFEQIKEKFAELRLYASGYNHDDRVSKTLSKYENLSRFFCGCCGKPAKYITTGWYYPLCEDCINLAQGKYIPIEDFYKFNSYKEVLDEIEKIKEV